MTTPATPIPTPSFDPVPVLARELSLPERGVAAVVKLLAEGATVPFIARYRKEARAASTRCRSARSRSAGSTCSSSRSARGDPREIDEQGKLTDELRAKLLACPTKAALEDLYLPYKPKRRTRAMIARERGLEARRAHPRAAR
jgi:uncharacterized protein